VDKRDDKLRQAQNTIEEVTGVRPALFRPPYGRKTPWELAEVRKQGMVTIGWNVSAKDPKQPSAEVIEQRVVQKVRPGAIVLLHDGGETRHGVNRSETAAALPGILEALQSQGYTFVTVPELLKRTPYQRQALKAGGQ
jgi:peptidoglycan/xylan/chitin deacetylase (PgdA/CDA1 family)